MLTTSFAFHVILGNHELIFGEFSIFIRKLKLSFSNLFVFPYTYLLGNYGLIFGKLCLFTKGQTSI